MSIELNELSDLNFLVTGGAGFIGSHITQYLLECGAKYVRIVDNLSTGKLKNIEHLLYRYKNLEFVHGDLTDFQICLKVTESINVVCHQAAIGSVPRSIEQPLVSHNSNVNGFLNILEAAKINGITRFVYASSSSVYGDDEHLPKIEKFTGRLLSPYAITKHINEIYASIYTELYKMECIGLRYFNVFGPRQDPDGPYAAVIPKFINMIKNNTSPIINGDGSYSRDFTYVLNVVKANVNAMLTKNSACYGNVFNIGCGDRITILQLFNSIKTIMMKDIEPIIGNTRTGDIPHSLANIEKAKNLLNYNPEILIDDGLKLTVNSIL